MPLPSGPVAPEAALFEFLGAVGSLQRLRAGNSSFRIRGTKPLFTLAAKMSCPSRRRYEQRIEATRAADVTANNELLLHVCEVLNPCA